MGIVERYWILTCRRHVWLGGYVLERGVSAIEVETRIQEGDKDTTGTIEATHTAVSCVSWTEGVLYCSR